MIEKLSENQNWAKLTPWMGVIASLLLFWHYRPGDVMFWALLNIPLYLFHQFEEHYWPGGFKNYMNHVIYKLPANEESLTDIKVFWINIIFVWVAFIIFGILSFYNIGFGLLIVIFSIINCLTHIVQGIKRRERNPGLVMASIQFLLSIYGAYFITVNALASPLFWWIVTIVFSAAAHAVLFRIVMSKK